MTQIDFFLSGGLNNSNPNMALGGAKSNLPIIGELNNLFSDISSEEASVGKTDYRCFYIMNTGSTTLNNASAYISDQKPLGSNVLVGVSKKEEIQRIRINNTITSGDILFNFDSSTFLVGWPGNTSGFALAIKAGFDSIGVDVDVFHTIPANFSSAYTIIFKNDSANKNLPLLKVQTNSLSGGGTLTINVTTKKIVSGSPLNNTPDEIATESTEPSGVNFIATNSGSKIELGDISPGDFIPIWAKRTTSSGTEYLERDYFTLRVVGGPF